MEDFDILYMMKTPFYLGDFDKAINESQQIEINPEDQRNQSLKNLYVVRSLTARSDFPQLKIFMQDLFKDPLQKVEVPNFSLLVQYLAQRVKILIDQCVLQKVDVQFLQTTFDQWLKEPQKVQSNQAVFQLLVYYFFIEEDYNRLFYLLNKSKNLELQPIPFQLTFFSLALKLVAQLKINRTDLAEQTLKAMKSIDEDNILTTLGYVWLTLNQAGQNLNIDQLISTLNEMGGKYEYTTKTYNLLGVVLMMKNDQERALKIFENAINELQLDTADGEAKHLYPGNFDLTSLLINCLKCYTMINGFAGGMEFFKGDEFAKKLLIYLGKVNQAAYAEFLEERKRAESAFDEAVNQLK